jgi:hypothetical protein
MLYFVWGIFRKKILLVGLSLCLLLEGLVLLSEFSMSLIFISNFSLVFYDYWLVVLSNSWPLLEG